MAMSYHFPYICGEKKGMSPPQALSTEVGRLLVFCRAEIFTSQRATGGRRLPSPELLWNLGRRSAPSRIFLGPLITRQGWRHQAGMALRVPGEPRSRDTCGAVQSLVGDRVACGRSLRQPASRMNPVRWGCLRALPTPLRLGRSTDVAQDSPVPAAQAPASLRGTFPG